MELIFLAVSFLASVVGSVCGIGGGVIIKPVLDATGLLPVSSISFLSGCTVLTMALITVSKQLRYGEKNIDVTIGTPLALGAAVGGILGKSLFRYAYLICSDENQVGAVQAGVLAIVTTGTLVFTLLQPRIRTKQIRNLLCCILIGLLLGILSSFLGIGGGPINLVVLVYFFSMETKKAAANSLYIILFSQAASLISTLLTRSVPEFTVFSLLVMIAGGFAGGQLGSRMNRTISAEKVRRLFCFVMVLIIGINLYNVAKF